MSEILLYLCRGTYGSRKNGTEKNLTAPMMELLTQLLFKHSGISLFSMSYSLATSL